MFFTNPFEREAYDKMRRDGKGETFLSDKQVRENREREIRMRRGGIFMSQEEVDIIMMEKYGCRPKSMYTNSLIRRRQNEADAKKREEQKRKLDELKKKKKPIRAYGKPDRVLSEFTLAILEKYNIEL